MKAVDLFAGCGGLSLGLGRAGVCVELAIDAWAPAVECYRANFDHDVRLFDLSDVDAASDLIGPCDPDMIVGGPPCQDFSHAGKRKEGDRANLTESFARIVDSVSPQCFIMENVDRAQKSNAYRDARMILKSAGFGLTEIVLNASQCGAPQNRKRFFCIGVKGAADNFLEADLISRLKSPMTVHEYFKGKLPIEAYYRHPRNYSRRAIYSVHEPAPTMRGVNRPVPKGYPGHPGDAIPLSDVIRPLTTIERAQVQTFPKRFKWVGTKTNVEQMIGNAVPVALAEYVAKSLLRYLDGSAIESVPTQLAFA